MENDIVIIFIAILYFALVAVMLYSVKTQNSKLGIIIKTTLGLIFVIPTIIHTWEDPVETRLIAYAFALSLLGDILLGVFRHTEGRQWQYYNSGVIAFAGAQLLFLGHTIRIGNFYAAAPIIALIGSVGFVIMNKKHIKSYSAWLSILYSFTLLTTLFNSILACIFGPRSDTMLMFMIGMILFFISDYVLFYIVFDRDNYVEWKDYINKSSYYVCQFLIMASVLLYF